MDDVMAGLEGTRWVADARYAVASFCSVGVPFTAEDVRRVAGNPPSPNAIGALFNAIAEEGWIVFMGYEKATRPEAHGRMIRVWKSAS
jgi:hypothetical protein